MKLENRKEEIIKTAAKLFKEKGYSAVTMRDIATAVGMKAASLYNHISSKQELLKIIIISLAEAFTQGMQEIKTSNISTKQKLEAVVKLHVDITAQNTFGMASLNNDWMHLEGERDYYLSLRSGYEADFRSILLEGIQRKEIADSSVEVMLFSILSTLRSLYLWIPKKEDVTPEDLSKSLSNVLINGINK
ncbi:TetR/AcrR family transcriptional regulator [Bizionia argentinensis JUB59]|uniref:TetR/AcrR family transcriptional regulator n=1 Tax=Bizionia argentinensis JUB59 TaxID=1046627 RepID=G2EA55_9FLAO|nr:TetR/AcrR family transcriptional regulator [Bizionia argentinensis]EGV44697.1 TetR/AcrR family transcriptional regulator [Bizionia argentinensis JUB59]